MEVSGQFHAPDRLLPGEEPPVPIGWEAGWVPEAIWKLWRREKHFSYRYSNPDSPAVAISARQLLCNWYVITLWTYDCVNSSYFKVSYSFQIPETYLVGWISKTSNFHPKGARFQYQPGHRILWLRFLVARWALPGKYQDSILKLGHDRFLQYLSNSLFTFMTVVF
jgi:hypothetical protein